MIEVLYRQVFNTHCRASCIQKAGSVMSLIGDRLVGPSLYNAMGISVNNTDESPFGANKAVFCHGPGTLFRTDLHEFGAYCWGQPVYSSERGLLTNIAAYVGQTVIGIILSTEPDPEMEGPIVDTLLTVVMRI